MKNYIVILALVLLAACQEEETLYSVDPALAPYVETFYAEASARGVTIPKNLIAEFSTTFQGISKSERSKGQYYLYMKPDLFASMDERQIEAHVYYRMAQVFLKIDIEQGLSFANPDFMFTPYDPANREVMLNATFD